MLFVFFSCTLLSPIIAELTLRVLWDLRARDWLPGEGKRASAAWGHLTQNLVGRDSGLNTVGSVCKPGYFPCSPGPFGQRFLTGMSHAKAPSMELVPHRHSGASDHLPI